MMSLRLSESGTTSTLVTLLMTLLITACSPEEYTGPVMADNTSPDTNGSTTTDICLSNTSIATLISGDDTGSVTRFVDPDADNLLETIGKLDVIDCDSGEAAFISAIQQGNYGTFTIEASGNWAYSASSSQRAIQNMTHGDSLQESFTVSSIDGTTHEVAIDINGADETVADITLSWSVPTQREDNTALLLSDITGYRVYVHRDSIQGELTNSIDINDRSAITYTFRDFSAGTYYFVITSYDSQGRESRHGSEIQVII